jgi:hypothetical protein
MGELQPVHRTPHVNVGKDDTNIVARRENGDGLVRIAGLDDVKSRRLDGGSGTHPDQKFVLTVSTTGHGNMHMKVMAGAIRIERGQTYARSDRPTFWMGDGRQRRRLLPGHLNLETGDG